ncbi:Thrombospondin-2 [Paragonimus skrjabini miyazakii]|uniref:Thrombospondin-2 n=1 Tax=Paragonimus skrjabini miyazakii TaxID=59628 RepID=A0A8S9YHT2_9TREM|nr:Thrombospondin-2 [Paragonimus skrjabini miyazakii]
MRTLGQSLLEVIFILASITTICYTSNTNFSGYHWGTWSKLPLSCSATCGRGLRCRVRKCLDGFGNEQPLVKRCHNPEDYDSKAESCTVCVVRAQCPSLPGWGKWGAWTSCTPNEPGGRKSTERCQRGVRTRYRKCDNPPPENPPFGIACSGSSQQTSDCRYNCDQKPIRDPTNVVKQIETQLENDHRRGLRSFKQVQRRKVGERVQMSCNTPTYKLAKRLTIVEEFNTRRKGFENKKLHLIWYKNGKPVKYYEPKSKMYQAQTTALKNSGQKAAQHPLKSEQNRWESLLPTTVPYQQDTDLIFPSILDGDQGFYTCEIHLGEHRWTAIFYSLIVSGIRYTTQATDPFYLHSNLGFSNALQNAPVWLEAGQIVWKINGQIQYRGLVARLSRRIHIIEHLNQTHDGMWTCYLVMPATGPMSRTSTPWVRVSGTFLLNEFRLRVDSTTNSLWQLAENPGSVRLLRNVSVTLALVCELMLLLLLLTVWAAGRWIDRSLSAEQKKIIIQEMLDNECRLMLTARKRAAINRSRLVTLVIQEQKRLELASIRLRDHYEPESSMEDEEWENETIAKRFSKYSRGAVSKIFKRVNSMIVTDQDGKRLRFSSIFSTDSGTSERSVTRRTTKLRELFGLAEEKPAPDEEPRSRPSTRKIPSKYNKRLSESLGRIKQRVASITSGADPQPIRYARPSNIQIMQPTTAERRSSTFEKAIKFLRQKQKNPK